MFGLMLVYKIKKTFREAHPRCTGCLPRGSPRDDTILKLFGFVQIRRFNRVLSSHICFEIFDVDMLLCVSF